MKKFLYSLFILFFVFTGCKGAYSPVDSDEVKLVNVKFANDNARYVSYYQENNNLKYEVTVYDANGDFYKLYDKQPFPSYEEFLEKVKMYPEAFETEGRYARENEIAAVDEPVIHDGYDEDISYSDMSEEELKAEYERLKAENSYYRAPYQFNIILPEGTYTFVMDVYGNEEGYNKDVLLLQGKTTADVKQLSDNRDEMVSMSIHIKLEEVETELKTGRVFCECYGYYGVIDSDYYFRYTTASDYEKNGNNASWKTSRENPNLTINQSNIEGETNFFVQINDLQPDRYILQFVFTFKKANEGGEIDEYVSYVSEIAEVRPFLTTDVRFDISTITQFGELTLYNVYTDTNDVVPLTINKYSYGYPFELPENYNTNYELAGWYEDEACTKESDKVQYSYYSYSDYQEHSFTSYAKLQESIKAENYQGKYSACINAVENRCSGDFSLYAKLVPKVVDEPIVEPSYISNCTIIFPIDELIENYSNLTVVLNYNDGSIRPISKGELKLSGNSASINNILLDVPIGNELRVDFHITDKDGVKTDILGYSFQIIGGKIENQNIDLSSVTIAHKAGGGGEEQNAVHVSDYDGFMDALNNTNSESFIIYIDDTILIDAAEEIVPSYSTVKILRNTTYEDGPLFYVDNNVTFGSSEKEIILDGQNVISNSPIIFIGNASVELTNVTMCNGVISDRGGAIGTDSSSTYSLSLNNCNFDNNSSAEKGGAIYLTGNCTALSILGGSFNNNSAIDGGAIYIDTSISTEIDLGDNENQVSFVGNSATNNGGGVYINKGRLNINNISLDNNSAEYYGGGIYIAKQEIANEVNIITEQPDYSDVISHDRNGAQYGEVYYFENVSGNGINSNFVLNESGFYNKISSITVTPNYSKYDEASDNDYTYLYYTVSVTFCNNITDLSDLKIDYLTFGMYPKSNEKDSYLDAIKDLNENGNNEAYLGADYNNTMFTTYANFETLFETIKTSLDTNQYTYPNGFTRKEDTFYNKITFDFGFTAYKYTSELEADSWIEGQFLKIYSKCDNSIIGYCSSNSN